MDPTSPRSGKSRIQELLSTFEQQATVHESPHTEIRRVRLNLQHQLEETVLALETQKKLYKQTLEEKNILSNRISGIEERIQELSKTREEEISQIKKVKEYNKLLKSENEKLREKVDQLMLNKENEEISEQQHSRKILLDLQEEIQNAEEKEQEKLKQDQNELRYLKYQEEINQLQIKNEENLDVIDEFKVIIQQNKSKIRELHDQLLSVVELAENLEIQLNKERDNHRSTKERYENLKYTKSDQLQREKRSQSYTTGQVNSYVQNEPFKEEVKQIDFSNNHDVNSMNNSNSNNNVNSRKKKKRPFMRKYGKSQTKLSNLENLIQPNFPVLPSPRSLHEQKREVAAGPDSKQELQKMEHISDANPIAMSEEQMKREFQVLLLLGETLQAELVNEKKQHNQTKKLLAEYQQKLDDLESKSTNLNGISGIITRRNKSQHPSSNSNVASNNDEQLISPRKIELKNDKLRNELKDCENSLKFSMDSNALASSKIDNYDLQCTVTEMISFADFLINSLD